MKIPFAVQTNIPGGRVVIDAGDIREVNQNWLGGNAVQLKFGDGGFVIVSAAEATTLKHAGVIAIK